MQEIEDTLIIVTENPFPIYMERYFSSMGIKSALKPPGDIYYPISKTSNNQLIAAYKESIFRYYLQMPGLEYLYRKQLLWISMIKNYGRENTLAFLPPTYLLKHEADRKRLERLVEANPEIKLIGKGNLQRRKSIIEIVGDEWKSIDDNFYVLVQEVIPCTKVIDSQVFNIRMYAVLSYSENKIELHLAPNGKFIYSTSENDLITSSKNEPKANYPRFLDEYFNQNRGLTAEEFWTKAKVIFALLFNGIIDKITQHKLKQNARSVAFLGVDVIIDENNQIKVLELNLRPDMNARSDEEVFLKESVVVDSVQHFLLNKNAARLDWIEVENWDAS